MGVVFHTNDSSVRQMLMLADFSTEHSNSWTTTAHACMHDDLNVCRKAGLGLPVARV